MSVAKLPFITDYRYLPEQVVERVTRGRYVEPVLQAQTIDGRAIGGLGKRVAEFVNSN
jgi:hypothetical protein